MSQTFFEQFEAEMRERETWPRWRRAADHGRWWLRYRLPRLPRDCRLAVHCARQRVTRGWDDRSVWGLDHWLSRTVGAQLVYMADIAHGWPGSYEGGFDGWVSDLRSNGEALLRYAEDRLDDMDDDTAYRAAQKAMRWVAENFGALWD